MRTIHFGEERQAAASRRVSTVGVAIAIHALAILMLLRIDKVQLGLRSMVKGPAAMVFIDMARPMPAATPAAPPGTRDKGANVDLAPVRLAPPARLEVLASPLTNDAVGVRLTPSSASPQQRQEARDDVAASPEHQASPQPHADAAPSAPASDVVAPPLASPTAAENVFENATKVIAIETINLNSATYTFVALTGDSGKSLHVERGRYRTIQEAIVHHVIGQIRTRYPDEIFWRSSRLGGLVRVSMRVSDQVMLENFLKTELFGTDKTMNESRLLTKP